MYSVNIKITNKQQRFNVGDTISGVVHVIAPVGTTLSDLSVLFHCIGEVKWIEHVGLPSYSQSNIYCDKFDYHEEELRLAESNVLVIPDDIHKTFSIPFSFNIPKDKHLPSSMISSHGIVKYFVCVTIREQHSDNVRKFSKQVIVLSPMEKNLMITVGGTAEKRVLLHQDDVSMHASIDRKGFAPGETITVHVTVDNATNASVTPQVSLSQVQIYMCRVRHKTIKAQILPKAIVGTEIAAHTRADQLLSVTIPDDYSLSIKCSVITLKYIIQVTLDITHSFDLHINLPVGITTKKVLEQLQLKKNEPERV